MAITQQEHWITGAEFNAERRRLVQSGAALDDPRVRELHQALSRRDDYLYERFGAKHRQGNEGKWIAVSLEGEVIIRDTLGELVHDAELRFGAGNASLRKLADFPGLEMRTP